MFDVKTEKLVRTLCVVVLCMLVVQIFLAVLVIMLCGDPNSRIGGIASVLTMVSGIILSLFLSKLFELFFGINFGELRYKFYSFDKLNSSDNDDKNSD